MAVVGKFRGPCFLHISSFRVVAAQISVPGCSTVAQVSEEQRHSPRASLETGSSSEQDTGSGGHGNYCFSLKLGCLN